MDVPPRLRFIYEFSLKNKRQWLITSRVPFRKGKCFTEGFECVVVITALELIRRTELWMTPDAVFQHFIPDITPARFCGGWVLSNLGWIKNCGRIEWEGHGV